VELLFSLEENTWNGRTTLQLKARDVRLDEA
jgi:single-stranded-DNA-specific exonuclease